MYEAYSIGVRVSLINHAGAGLFALSRQFMSAEGDAAKLERRVKSIQSTLVKGGLLAGAGLGILAAFKGPLEEAKKFQTEVARFQSLGFGDATNAQAVKFARGMKTIGTSARENMALLGDAMAVFKDLHHAEFAAPLMAKMKFGNEALYGAEQGGANDRKFMDMLKVIEFRGGLSSQGEFSTQADYVQKVIAGSRNRVDATAMLQALKTGGVALSRRGNEAFYLGGEPLIQEFGGSRYGTAAMSIYQNLVQSRGTETAQAELYRLGLLDKSKVEFNSQGRLKKALPGAFRASGILENEGELALMEKVLLPAFKAKGITSDEDIIREFGMILGNRTGSGLMARIYQQRAQIHNQSSANRNALGIDAMAAAGGDTMAGKQIQLHARFNTLMLNLGDAVLPIAIRGLEALIPMVTTLSNWMERNPTTVKVLTTAFIGLGVAMTIGGTVMVLSAAFRGLGLALQIGPLAITAARGIGLFSKALLFSTVGGPAGITGIAGRLTSVAGALGLVLQAATLMMTAYAAWKVGGMVSDHLDSEAEKRMGVKGETYGGLLYDYYNQYNPKTGKREFSFWKGLTSNDADVRANMQMEKDQSSTAIRRGGGSPIQVHTQLNIDGRRVGEAVSTHQANELARPQMGMSSFDSSQNGLPIGLNAAF